MDNKISFVDLPKYVQKPLWLKDFTGELYLVKITSIHLEPEGISYRGIYSKHKGYNNYKSCSLFLSKPTVKKPSPQTIKPK